MVSIPRTLKSALGAAPALLLIPATAPLVTPAPTATSQCASAETPQIPSCAAARVHAQAPTIAPATQDTLVLTVRQV
jgi:hypothetical protein